MQICEIRNVQIDKLMQVLVAHMVNEVIAYLIAIKTC